MDGSLIMNWLIKQHPRVRILGGIILHGLGAHSSGIPTQTAKLGAADMVSLLKNYLYKKKTEKKEPYVAVIHRLDQPVEGVLVFAKTPLAARELNKGM